MTNNEKNIYDCPAYACYLKDEKELLKSTSGGAFFGFAKYVIENGGVVFGAAFINSYEVHHIYVEDMKSLEKLRKSKYVQSRIGNTYKEAQKFLKNGRLVLFSGTPCQIAGLHSFLGKEYDNLLTVDLICHGVSTSKILKKHLEQLEYEYGKIYSIYSRSKEKNWDHVCTSYKTNNGECYVDGYEDAFFWGYEQYYFLRPSCYECKFRKMNSGADITIGDYWNIKKEHPDYYNEKGVSAVILKTKKGNFLFEKCKDMFECCESTVSQISSYNIFVIRPYGKTTIQKKFFDIYKQNNDLKATYLKMKQDIVPIKFGIIGSYSSRKMVNHSKNYKQGIEIGWQITGSAICSMMEKPIDLDITGIKGNNEYRYKALENDLKKKASNVIKNNNHCNYIIIDFLEERYNLLKLVNGCYITQSEMLEEEKDNLNLDVCGIIKMYDFSLDIWKEYCDQLIELLHQHYDSKQIVLNCLYLTENIGKGKKYAKFNTVDAIRKINNRLKQYYQYFEQKFHGIHVLRLENEDTDFCDDDFEFGCGPEYYNMMKYYELRQQLINIMEE